ncbi:MAG: hypothetical protein ACT6RD_13580, partial [Brevundimonas sp.]
MKPILTTASVLAITFGLAACATTASSTDAENAALIEQQSGWTAQASSGVSSSSSDTYPATAEGAAAFIASAETTMTELLERAARIQW